MKKTIFVESQKEMEQNFDILYCSFFQCFEGDFSGAFNVIIDGDDVNALKSLFSEEVAHFSKTWRAVSYADIIRAIGSGETVYLVNRDGIQPFAM